ncbi:MAG: hypothetical protein SOW34_07015 [Oliverpabstia sp.]|nr:hypothetical protein [Oliverpabstia sp.]
MVQSRCIEGCNQEGYERLGREIIVLAAKDYKVALKRLRKDPGNYMAEREIKEIEAFFHGSLYAAITTMDPDVILRKLRQEVEGL